MTRRQLLKAIACYWLVIVICAGTTLALCRIVQIYAPNPHVPFIASSAVRG